MFSKKTLMLCVLIIVSFINMSNAKQVVFNGIVVDSEDRPLAGAKAVLYDVQYERLMYSNSIKNIIEKTSDVEGKFSFTLEVAPGEYSFRFIIVKKDESALDYFCWQVDEVITEGKFQLSSPVEMSGTVVDQSGQPVSGSSVSVLMMQSKTKSDHSLNITVAPKVLNTITDEKGKFTFTNLSSDAAVDFLIQKEGKATVSTYVPGAPASEQLKYSPGSENVRIIQPEEARIEGVAIDKSSGKPIAGIPLMIRGNRNYQIIGQDITTTDENGKFSIRGICAGTYNIICVAPRDELADWLAEPASFNLELGQTREDIKVELIKGGLLEVIITETDNSKPIESASVSAYSEQTQQGVNGKSDKDGIARIRLLPGVYQSLRAYRNGYSSFELQNSISIEEGVTKHLEWQLGLMPKASGVVRNESGKPVKGVKIGVLPGGYGRDVESDEDGKFDISWDAEMFMDEREIPLLVCRYEEGNLAKVVILEGNTGNLDIKLEHGITLAGKVTDPEGKGIKNASIRIMLNHTMWSSTFIRADAIKTDETGNFTVKAIPAEHRYEVTVVADGHGNQQKDIHADDAVDNKLDAGIFTLPVANLFVSGVVVDVDGNPISDARIESRNHESGQPELINTQTDPNGEFVLNGVCEGKVNIRISANIEGKNISARAAANGGTSDIKIVARERGEYVTQNFTNKTHEQILRESEIVIAGVVVDENDSPVSGVAVGVNCIKREREDVPGKYVWSFSSYNDLTGTSDKQGRFAIALEEDAQYDLIFSPHNYAAMLVYDVPAGKKDLKVVLSKGGTISGQLVRLEGDKNIPIPNVQVKLEQSDRASYTYLGFDRDRTMITDTQGQFKFEHIQTRIRPHESMSKTEWDFVPRVWQLVYGDKTKTFAFYENNVIDNFEFIIEPDLTNTRQLKGNILPDFEGIKIDFDKEKAKEKLLLICFFDIEQRPSRSCILQLSEKAAVLKDKNIEVIAMHASTIEREYLNNWLKENNISFHVGMIEKDPSTSLGTGEEKIKFNWGVRALPWLILTDKKHIVTDEGLSVTQLEEEIKNNNNK